MRRIALAAVAAHLAVTAVHAVAHVELGVLPSTGEAVVITAFIYVLPAIAAWLIWRGARAGYAVLATSMIGTLAFATHHHFIAVSPDHVCHLPIGGWRLPFQVTAIASTPIDVAGAWVGVRGIARRS